MLNVKTAVCALLLVSACSGNPLLPPAPEVPGVDLPPGTAAPKSGSPIKRSEERDDNGNGFATDIGYDKATDTFFVDNLAFDGDNGYARDSDVRNLAGFQVYEGDRSTKDPVSGQVIPQFQHKAIRGASRTGKTGFSIVRTGSYVDYGFGGFVYERTGGVKIPKSGQAGYSGNYAALRDFRNSGGLEYATGKMTVAFDFKDFNEGAGVQGEVTSRRIFDVSGRDITQAYIAALTAKSERTQTKIPDLVFTVGPNTTNSAGEFTNGITSSYVDREGVRVQYESGKYYAVLAGDSAEEITGVVVVEGEDPFVDGVTARESGGFILYRKP